MKPATIPKKSWRERLDNYERDIEILAEALTVLQRRLDQHEREIARLLAINKPHELDGTDIL